jgi:RNA-directed DNA polymerase
MAGRALLVMSTRTFTKTLSESDHDLRTRFFRLQTREDIAIMLGVTEQDFIYYFLRGGAPHYVEFEITKRGGGVRKIASPTLPVKVLQRKLNQALQAIYRPKRVVHGFARRRSIRSNAGEHHGRRFVLNVDLKDFFPSIHFGRVRGLFMGKPFGLPRDAAQALAQVCCYKGRLPQGAPTSPVVSNMIGAGLDVDLRKFAWKLGWAYTRYADDLTFSSDRKVLPADLVRMIPTDGPPLTQLGDGLRNIIEKHSFEVNARKVRLRACGQRQIVTGLVVNEFPNVAREYVRELRAILHTWSTRGLEEAEARFRERDRRHRRPSAKPVRLPSVVKGRLEFIRMVKGHRDPVYANLWNRLALLDPSVEPIYWVRNQDELPMAVGIIESDDLQGSAFYLDRVGWVTCAHCIGGNPKFRYQGESEKSYPVSVVRSSAHLDLAIFTCEALIKKVLSVGDSEGLKHQNPVVLAGFPDYGPGSATIRITSGEVSGFGNRQSIPSIFITNQIFSGNSGGPLLNENLEVVGVARIGTNPVSEGRDIREPSAIRIEVVNALPAVAEVVSTDRSSD